MLANLLRQTLGKVSSANNSGWKGTALFSLGTVAAGIGLGSVLLDSSAAELHASGLELHPPKFAWYHQLHLFTGAFDHASIRRGFEVYRQVCSTCHSLNYVKWRNLIGVTHTLPQVKAMSALQDVTDGPNDKGEMYTRPGSVTDGFRNPYPNEEFARFANNGALPPDLSLMVKARQPSGRAEDYVFSLLTGYKDEPPAGITLRQGLYYNPYFPGGAIAMPPPLLDGMLDYEDGTAATVSQLAKDVTQFLCWTAEPEHDRRILMGCQSIVALGVMAAVSGYMTRWRWSILKTRRRSWAGPRYNMKAPPVRK